MILGHHHFDVCLVFQVFWRRFACFVPTLEDCRLEHVKALFPSAYRLRPRKFAFAVGFEHPQTGQGFGDLASIQTGADFIAPNLRGNKPTASFAMIPTEARPVGDRLSVGIGSCNVVEAAITVRLDEMTDLSDCLASLIRRRTAALVESYLQKLCRVV